MVAAKIANLEHGGDRKSNQAANLPLDAVTQPEAAALLNVGERSVRSAKQVLDECAPQLVSAVEHGDIAVSTAAEIATLPEEEQEEVIAKGESEILRKANIWQCRLSKLSASTSVDHALVWRSVWFGHRASP
jgi:hypothetical protein